MSRCHVPRCKEPALTLVYPRCYRHALEAADADIAAAHDFRTWVLARRPLTLDGDAA